MRRDDFEVGLEREYALYAVDGETVSYLLATDRLLAIFEAQSEWKHVEAKGWRVVPEYSHCLVELVSPPYARDGWPELLATVSDIEGLLARAVAELQSHARFAHLELTADYSARTDRFVTWDGTQVTALDELLLDPAEGNWLVGAPDTIPPCLVGCSPELLYAGFTSTNLTVHPPHGSVDPADYYWRLLHAARQLDVPQRHPILREGRFPVPPDPDRSIRDALIRWADPATAALLDSLPRSGELPSPSQAYSCRTRVVEGVMLFELRCFHSGLPLANLAPLLAVR